MPGPNPGPGKHYWGIWMYNAKVLADSINTDGDRLISFQVTHPRIIHADFMTHRVFSRNSSSSRAIPVRKMVEQVMVDPFIPVYWGKNQAGMQATRELTDAEKDLAVYGWLKARDNAVATVDDLTKLGVHKQIANRLLEPWMWITVIVSATEWQNYFSLRQDSNTPYGPDLIPSSRINPRFPAQPEIQAIAHMTRELFDTHTPVYVPIGEWHLPMIQYPDDRDLVLSFPTSMIIKISTGRTARVSYLTHDGRRDAADDMRLHDDLMKDRHWSPFEHQAKAAPGERSSNFVGWHQYRKDFLGESGSSRKPL